MKEVIAYGISVATINVRFLAIVVSCDFTRFCNCRRNHEALQIMPRLSEPNTKDFASGISHLK